ncbi:MAG: hypothetical protein RR571_02715 [Anaerorhabdus sp.]
MLSLFDISINLIEASAIACFVTSSLSFSKRKKTCFIFLQISIFLGICLANILQANEDLFVIMDLLIIFFITRKFSNSASQDIAIITIVSFMIPSLANISALFVVTSVNSLTVIEMINYYPILFKTAIILSKVFLLFIQYIVSKAYRKIFIESTKFFGEFISILILSRTSFIILENMLFFQTDNQTEIFTAVLLESMIVSLLIYIYYKVQNDNRINLGKLKRYTDITSYKEQFEAVKIYMMK